MQSPDLRVGRSRIADEVEFGDDVIIEADEAEIGPGCRIGFSDADDFRTPPGVRIKAKRIVFGAGVTIGRAVRIEGGEIRLDAGVRVLRHATINVRDQLTIGAHGTVGESCEISGRRVVIGQELWMLPHAKIGGGSAFEYASSLHAGHFLHLGVDTLINTARPVVIGHEVGLGTRTSIYTHGAYPSRLEGFPVAFDAVEIGDFSWLPGAIVNPGVRIGRNCVVGVNSLVTSDLPDGCLAVGSPAKVVKETAYPRPMSAEARAEFFEGFLAHYAQILGQEAKPARRALRVSLDTTDGSYVFGQPAEDEATGGRLILVTHGDSARTHGPAGWTVFDTATRRIRGLADAQSERLANELRRFGIRFYSRRDGEHYVDWEANVPGFA